MHKLMRVSVCGQHRRSKQAAGQWALPDEGLDQAF